MPTPTRDDFQLDPDIVFLNTNGDIDVVWCQPGFSVLAPAVAVVPNASRLLAANPARLFRLGHRKGALEPGKDADIVVMAHKPGRYG